MAGRKIGEAFVAVSAQPDKGIGKEIEKGLVGPGAVAGDKAGKSTGHSFTSGLLKVTTGLGAAGAAIGFFKGAVSEGVEAQKVGAQTAAVLKSTGNAAGISAKQIGDLATAISNKTGVDDEAIQSNENLLLTFTNIKNVVGQGNDVFNQATQAVSDMSAALGQDGKSSAIQLGKALNDPIKGITALSRVGVSFTADQKKQIATLVKSGDTLKAQKIILGEVQKEFGGSAAAIATPGEKMSVAWKNLQETIGLKLLPVIAKLSAILIPIFTFIANNLPVVAAFVGIIVVLTAAIKLWSIWQAIINGELVANPIGLIVVAIAALVAGIIYVATKTKFFQTVWHAAWDGIKTAALFVWNNVLKPIFKLWVLEFQIVWGVIKAVAHWFANDFVGFFTKGAKWVSDKITGLVNFFKGIPGKIATATSGMFDGIKNAFRAAINWIIDKWNDLHFSIPGVNTHIPGVGTIGGFTLNTPNIPRLAKGAMVPATPGGRLVIMGDGGEDEFAIPRSKLGAAMPVIHNHFYVDGEEFRTMMRTEIDEANRGTRRSSRAGAGARSSSVRYA